jgi:hypothetical protein
MLRSGKNIFTLTIVIIAAFGVFLALNPALLKDDMDESETTQIIYGASGYNKYLNNSYGYEIVLPDELVLSEDIVSVKTRFESDDMAVDVLYDNFEDTLDSFLSYNMYGNMGIKKNKDFTVTGEYERKFGGNRGHVLIYERNKISSIENDRNYYATIAIERTYDEVVTVFIKSSHPIEVDEVMRRFKFIRKRGEVKENRIFEPVQKSFSEPTEKFYLEYFKNNEKTDFGIFDKSVPLDIEKLRRLESMFDYKFPVVLMYNNFYLPFKSIEMENAKKAEKVVEYTLYTTDLIDGKEKDITLEILSGSYDEYLDSLAKSFKEYDYPVLFRLNNEMNGDWVLYSAYNVGKDTDLFIGCWRYIYDRFREKGVDNLIFVWNPNERSFPNFAYNSYLNYYPGDEYVDIVGLTAYNTGNYYEGEIWRSFSEAYDSFYHDYAERFRHPFMITEFSCASAGGDKPAWFSDMFEKISGYDRIKIAVLWNGQDYDMTRKERPVARNYKFDNEKRVIEAIKKGLQSY